MDTDEMPTLISDSDDDEQKQIFNKKPTKPPTRKK